MVVSRDKITRGRGTSKREPRDRSIDSFELYMTCTSYTIYNSVFTVIPRQRTVHTLTKPYSSMGLCKNTADSNPPATYATSRRLANHEGAQVIVLLYDTVANS